MTAAGVISLAVGCAAVTEDLLYRRISNWTAGAGFLGGILLHAWQGGWRGGLWALAGASVGFIVFLVFFLAKGMGGGDVKLMAAFGSLVGPGATLSAAWAAAVFGGLMALTFAAVGALRRRKAPETIPYAPAIVTGVWLAQFVLG
jgi:prepilin peptidase CpaA